MSELREGQYMNNPDLSSNKQFITERATTMEKNDKQLNERKTMYRSIMDSVIRDRKAPLQRLKNK